MAKKIATPGNSDNVAQMMTIGQPKEPAQAEDMSYLNNVMETISPLVSDGETVAEPEAKPTEEKQEPPAPPVNETLPEKLRGKTPEEMAAMYLNLESEVGKHRNEVGTMRKWVDQLLTNGQAQQTKPAPQEVKPEDNKADIEELNLILTSPTKYRAKIQQDLMNQLAQIGQQSTMQQVVAQNTQVLQDPAFAEWVRTTVPKTVAEAGDKDPATFNYIVNQFKSTRQAQPPVVQQAQVVQAPGVAQGVGSVPRSSPKQEFSRMKMMELHNTNEAEYKRLLPEYMIAIQEKRVKP